MTALLPRAPRLFFHAYDHQRRQGGQKHTYAQVDALRRHGISAYVVHGATDFRLTWFDNDTAVIGREQLGQLYDPALDLWVLPEDLGAQLYTLPGPKVIFNKGIYNGFRTLPCEPEQPSPYERPDVIAALCVSDHNAGLLRCAYPSLPVYVTRPGICVERFPARALVAKQRQIAWVPKNPGQLASLRHILGARARQPHSPLGSFTWLRLSDLAESELAAALQESLLFVSLSVEEGYGLLPREAALCGCIVLSYDTGTLQGLAPESLVPPGDLLTLVQHIEDIAARFPHELAAWQGRVDLARQSIAAFDEAAAGREAVAVWQAILAGHRAGHRQ